MAVPTFDLTLCPPGGMRMPSIKGGALDGGRALSGVVQAADLTGGGLVSVSYSKLGLGNIDPRAQRYWSRLGGILNPGVRSIIVPLMVDFINPTFPATFGAAAAQNAGTVTIAVTGMRPSDVPLQGGEWFGIFGPQRGNRAHVVTEVDSAQVNSDGTASFTVGIAPPLREAQGQGAVVNFVRPTCLMRLASGSRIESEVEPAWWTTPDVEFIESFGTN